MVDARQRLADLLVARCQVGLLFLVLGDMACGELIGVSAAGEVASLKLGREGKKSTWKEPGHVLAPASWSHGLLLGRRPPDAVGRVGRGDGDADRVHVRTIIAGRQLAVSGEACGNQPVS